MKKLFLLFLLLIFVSGCYHLTSKSIIKNPERVAKECNKFESADERNGCFMKFAKDVSLVSDDTSVIICDNLAPGFDRNKCLFGVFSNLERNGKLDDGIEICKKIDKEGFLEFCENRRVGGSIIVAPSLA